MNDTLTPKQRLQQIAASVEPLTIIAPTESLSGIRQMGAKIADAALMLARVIDAAPHSVPGLSLARFSTSAENAISNLIGLAKIYGVNPTPDQIDTEAEADFLLLTESLYDFARSSRKEAITKLREDAHSTTELVAAWRQPEAERRDMVLVDVVQGQLASTFLSASSKRSTGISPFSQTTNFMGRIFRKSKSDKAKIVKIAALTDDEVATIVDIRKMNQRKFRAVNLYEEEDIRVRKRLSMSSEERGEFHHTFLTETGLCAHSDDYNELLITTSNRVPKIRTKMWDEIATHLAGDADAYHRALTFKDDETFRTTLKNAVITALNVVENSVLAGVPLCKSDISDPVICAAIQATLTELGGQSLTRGKYTAKSSEDVFGIRAGLEAVLTAHHGITLNMFKDAVTIWPVESIRTPEGLTKKLHEQHDNFIHGVLKKTGEIMRLDAFGLKVHTFPTEAQNIAGDLRVNLECFYEAVINSHKYTFRAHEMKYVAETVDTGEIRVIAGSAAEVDAYLEFRNADQEITATP